MHIFSCINMYIYIHVYTHTYIHMYTRTRTHTHTYIYIRCTLIYVWTYLFIFLDLNLYISLSPARSGSSTPHSSPVVLLLRIEVRLGNRHAPSLQTEDRRYICIHIHLYILSLPLRSGSSTPAAPSSSFPVLLSLRIKVHLGNRDASSLQIGDGGYITSTYLYILSLPCRYLGLRVHAPSSSPPVSLLWPRVQSSWPRVRSGYCMRLRSKLEMDDKYPYLYLYWSIHVLLAPLRCGSSTPAAPRSSTVATAWTLRYDLRRVRSG